MLEGISAKATMLLLGGSRHACRSRGVAARRQRIDHLTGTRIVQLFASLMFNRVRIVLKPVDMPLQRFILALETMQLLIQALRVLPLLLVRCKPVLPKDDVVPHRQCKQSSSTGCNLSPAHLTLPEQTRNHTRSLRLRTHFAGTSHLRFSTNF